MRGLRRRLIELGAHFGDTVHGNNFSTESYIIGTRRGFTVIDVSKTLIMLRSAIRFVKKVSEFGGRTVMYYYNGFQMDILSIFLYKLSKLFSLCVLYKKWVPGSISNYYSCFYDLINELQDLDWIDARRSVSFMSIFFRVLYFTTLDIPIDTTLEEQYKKSISYWRAAAFIRYFRSYYCLPDNAICVDAPYSSRVCQEFSSLGIPVVAPVNTRSDLLFISYPIVSNNSSALLCLFYFSLFGSAVRDGRRSSYVRIKEGIKHLYYFNNLDRITYMLNKRVHVGTRRKKNVARTIHSKFGIVIAARPKVASTRLGFAHRVEGKNAPVLMRGVVSRVNTRDFLHTRKSRSINSDIKNKKGCSNINKSNINKSNINKSNINKSNINKSNINKSNINKSGSGSRNNNKRYNIRSGINLTTHRMYGKRRKDTNVYGRRLK